MSDYRLIPLRGRYGKGKFAKVSPEDFEWASRYKWRCNRLGYPMRTDGHKNLFLHREVAQTPGGMKTDHINGDKLDARRCNLRHCTHADNMRNRKADGRGSSRFKGVNRRPSGWRAEIQHQGRSIHLGTFDDEEDAARHYDEAARELFGAFARLNFP